MNEKFQEIKNRASNIASRAKCATDLAESGSFAEARIQYNILSDNIKEILREISALENAQRNESLPSKAYRCIIPNTGMSAIYIPAKTASKARYVAFLAIHDSGHFRIEFKHIVVHRAPRYDEWAKTAKKQCTSEADMPVVV